MRSIRNCSVAVVGGAGFLGSHMVRHLVEDRGCKVLVIDNLVAGRREFIHPAARFEYADITGSESHLRKLFEHHKVRHVWNWAACPYVPFSFERPVHVFDVNAFGAMKVINAAWEAGCEAIGQVSSAELYGEQEGPISESVPVKPHSSYGASKAAVDFWVQARWREAKVPVLALRQFNCVGPFETHEYVVPTIISQLLQGEVVRLGNNSERDFLYAGDAVRMATELLEKGSFGEVYNSGSGESVRIYDLAERLGRIMGRGHVFIEVDPARVRPWEIWSLRADSSKLYSVIETRPEVSLDSALERTVAWYHQNGGRWPWQ